MDQGAFESLARMLSSAMVAADWENEGAFEGGGRDFGGSRS